MHNQKLEQSKMLEEIIRTDNKNMFMTIVNISNNPEKIKPMIELCFDFLAYKCLATLMDRYPNYDKFINKLFLLKEGTHFDTPEFEAFQKKFWITYQELQKIRYKPLDTRELKKWNI